MYKGKRNALCTDPIKSTASTGVPCSSPWMWVSIIEKDCFQVIENAIYKVGGEVTLDASRMEFGEDLIYT